MNVIQIKYAMRRLSLNQLRKLDEWLHKWIQRAEATDRAEQSAKKHPTAEHTLENKTYRLESVLCGKEKCKCALGKPHGPYWYSYTRLNGKVISQYIGKKLPGEVERSLNKGMTS